MSLLDQLITVDIVVSATAPSAANFGVPMVAAYHTHYPDLIRYYTDLAGMVSDGFAVTEPAYLAASAFMDQNPTVTSFAIGRRALAFTQVIALTLSSASATDTYGFGVIGSDGIVHDISLPSTGVATTDATAMAALFTAPTVVVGSANTGTLALTATQAAVGPSGTLTVTITTLGVEGTAIFKWSMGTLSASGITTGTANALAGTGITLDFGSGTAAVGDTYTATIIGNVGTVTHSSGIVTWTQASGKMNNFLAWGEIGAAGGAILSLADHTTDPGIATDLAAIYNINQGWYGLGLDSNSTAEVEAAAAWAEANGPHVFCWNISDTAAIGSGTTAFTSGKALGYTRNMGQFNGSELLSYGGCAILGVILPQTPGTYTPAYKTLVGVPADPTSILTGTAITNLNNARGNYYTSIKGVNILLQGITPSGEYLDTTIFIDWLKDAIQTAVFTLLTNNLKIAYTDGGVAQIVNVLKGVLKQGILNQGLAASPAPTVSAPLVANIALSNVAQRNVPNITFTATLAGAIQSLSISGSVVLP